MAENESTNTMLQNAFAKIGDGNFALKTTGTGAGGTNVVSLDQNAPNNTVTIATNQIVSAIPPSAARSTSTTAAGSVAAPGAAAAIATTASLALGTWDVEVKTHISGTTVAATDSPNMRLIQNAVNLGTVITPVASTTGSTSCGEIKQRIQVATAGALTVNAIGAATAGSTYHASIVATRVM